MSKLVLLFLVILVIAVAHGSHKHKSKKHSKKTGLKFNLKVPKIKIKKVIDKFASKVGKPRSPPHSHSHSYHVSHQISHNYKINIEHSYKKEVHCSKHCVPDKAYWHEDHCVCHAGLAGAGDLCCTDPKEYKYTCTVRGDPYVHSYMGQTAQVFNPCGQVLSVIYGKTKSHQTCKVTVRSADVIEQGIFITNQVEVTYAISGYKEEHVILDGYRYYSSLKESWEELGEDYKTCFDLHGENVQILKDKYRKVWTIIACGVNINFRRDSRGGKPGMCASSVSEFSQRECDKPDDIVCNRLSEDTFPYHSKAVYYLFKSFENKEYLKLRLTCAYAKLCRKATKTFNKCSPARRTKAANVCSTILERDFRSCAYLHEGLDGAKLFHKFLKCLKAYCNGDQDWCYEEKKSSVVMNCDLPKVHCCDFKLGGGDGFQQKQIPHEVTQTKE